MLAAIMPKETEGEMLKDSNGGMHYVPIKKEFFSIDHKPQSGVAESPTRSRESLKTPSRAESRDKISSRNLMEDVV